MPVVPPARRRRGTPDRHERRSTGTSTGRPRARLALVALLGMIVALPVLGGPAGAATAVFSQGTAEGVAHGLTLLDAAILGLVEGITEFLPVSSTGHLAVVQDLLGVGEGEAKTAADAYAIVIQAGAILAVLVLYRARVLSLINGLLGRDEAGRRILTALAISVVPGVVLALLLEDEIKEELFGVKPVIAAWVVGGLVILVLSFRGWWDADVDVEESRDEGDRSPLERITVRHAAVIGAAQCLALWPGTSRSLVTIIAALAIGLELGAAVEFSFLLGLVILSGATVYDGAKHGGEIMDQFGVAAPVLGFVVAFASAVIAIRWMVGYLQTRSLVIFGWYRLGAAAVATVLVLTGTIVV